MLPKFIILLLIVFSSLLSAQNVRPTLAVVDFDARGIATLEAQTLTDRFRTSIGKTGTVRLVERRMMQQVLEEQGFQQTGCTTDECAVEVGKLLGVQQMVGGAIGKVGDTFTIDARMISVETGESIRTKSITYVGKVDGLIIEIEVLAYEMMEVEPPKSLLEKRKLGTQAFSSRPRIKTRMGALIRSTVFPGLGQFYAERKLWGYGWILSELVVGGLIYTSYTAYQTANDEYDSFQTEYDNATDPDLIADLRAKVEASLDDMTTANDQIEMLAYAGAGLWLGNMIHAFIVGPKSNAQANSSAVFQFVYDPNLQQPQLRLTIALD